MPEIMEDFQTARRTADMRRAGTPVQIAVCNELAPQGNGVVVHAGESDIAHVEFTGPVKIMAVRRFAAVGQGYALPLHAPPQCLGEIVMLVDILLLFLAYAAPVHVE